jgi:mevalonate kinase
LKNFTLFVPGRLCLFGEHSDWAGGYRARNSDLTPGYCLTVGTTQGITAEISMNGDGLRVSAHDAVASAPADFVLPLVSAELLRAAQSGNFYAYCAGVAAYMREKYRIGNTTIHTTQMNLPIKKGVSSSAAICILTVRAFNQLYELGLSTYEEMECAYQGEILTGSQCGRMDQICAFGQVPALLTFDGEQMNAETLKPHTPLHFVIIDLQRGKDTRKILHELNHAFANNTSSIGKNIRDALGTQNARILTQARQAIEAGNPEAIGQLMQEAQAIFDQQVAPACPSELASPKLHDVLQHSFVHELSWGGKGVGSQGDGSAQLIARDAEAQHELITRLPALLDVGCLELTIVPSPKP